MLDLLDEVLLLEVLSLLPINEVLQLRSVSKSWRSLIQTPYFCDIHHLKHQQRLNQTKYVDPRTLLLSDHRLYALKFTMINRYVIYKELSDLLPLKHTKIDSFQSCNGVLCIHHPCGKIVIWNPLSNKYRELHSPTHHPHPQKPFGFGYDRVTDDYKLVALQGVVDDKQDSILPTIAEVYSLKSGTWKKIDGFSHRIRSVTDGVFVGDSLHWVAQNKRIVAFNLTTHELHELSPPSICSSPLIDACYVGALDGRLSLICKCGRDLYGNPRETTFVMESYEDMDSWTSLTFDFGQYNHGLKFKAYMKNGEVLLGEGGGNLVFYDKKIDQTTGTFNNVEQIHTYVPTLGFYCGINKEGDKTKRGSKALANGIRKKGTRPRGHMPVVSGNIIDMETYLQRWVDYI